MKRHKQPVFHARGLLAVSSPLWIAALISTVPVLAAEHPERPLRAIVSFPPGGANDVLGRAFSPHLSRVLGQPVNIDNRPGESGFTGVELTAKAAPDGYTILFSSATPSTQLPALFRKPRFDPAKDIKAVAAIGDTPHAIAINSHLPVRNVAELIRLAGSNPGKLDAASAGVGTRMNTELFQFHNNIKIRILGYNSTGPTAIAVATGESQFTITDVLPISQYLASGRVKLLAIAGDKRLAAYPTVPTIHEAGVHGYKAGTKYGIYVPGNTPVPVVQKLNAAVNSGLGTPEILSQLQKLGIEATPTSTEEFAKWYLGDLRLWTDIVARAKIPTLD